MGPEPIKRIFSISSRRGTGGALARAGPHALAKIDLRAGPPFGASEASGPPAAQGGPHPNGHFVRDPVSPYYPCGMAYSTRAAWLVLAGALAWPAISEAALTPDEMARQHFES